MSGDSDQISLRAMPTAAFIGYRQFPPLMNLYVNYSGILSAVKSYKLCGAVESDFRYLVEYHLGYTPRGPLNFGRGFYLRNGKNFRDPILAATGEQFPLPLLVSLFDPETVVKLPPLDMDKNPRDMVDEVLRAATSKEYGVIFRFTTEVGVKRMQRESFEWWKERAAGGGTQEEGGHKVKTRYTLHRLASSTTEDIDGDCDLVAVLSFNHVLSVTHVFTLEMKGTGLTGELGDRWTLMVVMTALSLHLLRQLGKTGKATVGAAQKIYGK
ncbi:hypothetical protein C7999DRAFT_15043 [Corynascus novoguineensis]|uniref:Uncharacterized protein n=1 Tax=Corynascus novoguineensis TaxID=1126955 RepID=A0AAN7CR84_9PEZI|nr:hypothetical protein C7999DRAFT_15043 [Corynascus novoguineensis]